VFNVLAERSTCPVEVLMNTKPAGVALKVPPAVPVIVGIGSVPDEQNVEPE
jgi:hypothetical protein